jgi:hypothetical protein
MVDPTCGTKLGGHKSVSPTWGTPILEPLCATHHGCRLGAPFLGPTLGELLVVPDWGTPIGNPIVGTFGDQPWGKTWRTPHVDPHSCPPWKTHIGETPYWTPNGEPPWGPSLLDATVGTALGGQPLGSLLWGNPGRGPPLRTYLAGPNLGVPPCWTHYRGYVLQNTSGDRRRGTQVWGTLFEGTTLGTKIKGHLEEPRFVDSLYGAPLGNSCGTDLGTPLIGSGKGDPLSGTTFGGTPLGDLLCEPHLGD